MRSQGSVRFYLFSILLSTSLILPLTSPASPLSIRAEIERDRLKVAEPVRFTVTITAEKGVEFFTPDEKISLYPFEILRHRVLDEREDKGKEFKRVEYLITSYEIGEFEIPSLILPYKDKAGEMKEASTRPIRVVVEGVAPPEAEELKGIRGPLRPDGLESASRKGSFWIIPSLITGILLAITLPFLLRRRKKNEGGTKASSPLEEAIKELEGIRARGLLEKGEVKRYHVLIADVVRRYIGNRFSLPVRVMTTQELMNKIKEIVRDDGKMDLLLEVLTDCDLVKFSTYKPPLKEAKETVERAREAITIL